MKVILKQLLGSWRVWFLIVFVLLSILAINPKYSTSGVLISSIDKNSSADINSVNAGEVIFSMDGDLVSDLNDYYDAVSELEKNDVVKIRTDKTAYSFVIDEVDGLPYTGINVKDIPKSNLKKGLDLVGGVRVILQPEEELSEQEFIDVIDITLERLNVFGLTDVVVRKISDLEGNNFLLVELAGADKESAAELISKQGKFEATVGNTSVFAGDDIKQVWRSADQSGVRNCGQAQTGWSCQFQFRVDISPEAAKRHAAATKDLSVLTVGNERYLEEKLYLYLDDELVDELYISEDLKGSEHTSFSISGGGQGENRDEAFLNALNNMKNLQTILITGSLPVKMNIVKMDVVSPTLGEEFFSNAIRAVVFAIFAVGAVVFVRFRKLKIAVPMILTGLSEVIIILGVAALIRWNLDLAAIAGILAAVGTGVDDQIVITDEVLSGTEIHRTWKERMKRAFFIIMAAYVSTVAAMVPLAFAGAGLLKGFAIITIIGVSIGVFVTRPAYAKIVEVLLK
jgi:preprotein translocase subunit SecD